MDILFHASDKALSELVDRCICAGAQGFAIFDSREDVTVFFHDPEKTHPVPGDAFDELHIQLGTKARILIAVFTEQL